jgi:hypothetical protein
MSNRTHKARTLADMIDLLNRLFESHYLMALQFIGVTITEPKEMRDDN